MLNVITISVSQMTSYCTGTVQNNETKIRKRNKKVRRDVIYDGSRRWSERGSSEWHAMEDCSTDKRLQQERSVIDCGQTSTTPYCKYFELSHSINIKKLQLVIDLWPTRCVACDWNSVNTDTCERMFGSWYVLHVVYAAVVQSAIVRERKRTWRSCDFKTHIYRS